MVLAGSLAKVYLEIPLDCTRPVSTIRGQNFKMSEYGGRLCPVPKSISGSRLGALIRI
jgi:hypothetical protein